MCVLPVWGFWWILPLVLMLICFGFFFVMRRSRSAGHGCMCTAGHRSTPDEAR
jgi:hypothetical protein